MTSAAKANRNAEIVDRLEAEVARLRATLEQVATVCRDNSAATCNHAMALNFVEQIANAASPKQPGAT